MRLVLDGSPFGLFANASFTELAVEKRPLECASLCVVTRDTFLMLNVVHEAEVVGVCSAASWKEALHNSCPAPAQGSISVKGGGGLTMVLQLRSAWFKMPWPSECRGWVQCLRSLCVAEALDQKRL